MWHMDESSCASILFLLFKSQWTYYRLYDVLYVAPILTAKPLKKPRLWLNYMKNLVFEKESQYHGKISV